MPSTAITVAGLTKRFGGFLALDDVSFTVPRGALYGFLGPNGAGKTTTLGILTGLLRADAGHVAVDGTVGAMVEEPAFYPFLTARANLRLLARIAGRSNEEADEALAGAALSAAADRKTKGFSHGQKRRLGLAAALLRDPDVLILDEPTSGLDPAGQEDVHRLFTRFSRAGGTVLVSSHILSEVEAVATHVAMLVRGRIVAHGPLGAVLHAKERLVFVVDDAERAREVLATLTHPPPVTVEHGRIIVESPITQAAPINRALVEAGIAVSGLAPLEGGLRERFLQLSREGTP